MAHVKGHEDIYKGRKIPPRKKETIIERGKRATKAMLGITDG